MQQGEKEGDIQPQATGSVQVTASQETETEAGVKETDTAPQVTEAREKETESRETPFSNLLGLQYLIISAHVLQFK